MQCAGQRHRSNLTLPPGWVQTNRPPISKGEKVCVAARSLFLWNRLPLEVIYTRNERTHLPRQPQLGSFPVNRQLGSADMAQSEQGAFGEAILPAFVFRLILLILLPVCHYCIAHSLAERSMRSSPGLPTLRSASSAGPAERFVYATSTTQGHQLVGEERFSVEWHQKDNSVWCAGLCVV